MRQPISSLYLEIFAVSFIAIFSKTRLEAFSLLPVDLRTKQIHESKHLSAFVSQFSVDALSVSRSSTTKIALSFSNHHNKQLGFERRHTLKHVWLPIPPVLRYGPSTARMRIHANNHFENNSTDSSALGRPPWEVHLNSMASTGTLTEHSDSGDGGTDMVVIGKIIIDEFVLRSVLYTFFTLRRVIVPPYSAIRCLTSLLGHSQPTARRQGSATWPRRRGPAGCIRRPHVAAQGPSPQMSTTL